MANLTQNSYAASIFYAKDMVRYGNVRHIPVDMLPFIDGIL